MGHNLALFDKKVSKNFHKLALSNFVVLCSTYKDKKNIIRSKGKKKKEKEN